MLKVIPIGLALVLASPAHADPLAIVTTALPAAGFGDSYNVPLSAIGGMPPYEWCGPGVTACIWSPDSPSPLQGTLPPGILVSADGVISGSPQGAGSYSFELQVHDAMGATLTSNFYTIDVVDTGYLQVTTDSLPAAFLGQPYDVTLNAAGGRTPYAHDPIADPQGRAGWLILDSTRAPVAPTDSEVDLGPTAPPGLTLDLGGKLSGVPSEAGNYTVTFQVIDSNVPPEVATGIVTLTVSPANGLRFLNSELPEATLREPYRLPLQTSATDPKSVAYLLVDSNGDNSPAARASLPPGITLSTDGLLEGRPTAAGSFVFLVQAIDGQNRVATQALQISVVAATASGGCSSLPGAATGAPTLIVLGLLALVRLPRRDRD
jgi:hypothetical protein